MPDQLIQDIPLIRRYSRHNEYRDSQFAAFLKQSNLSNNDLDSTVHQATKEVWARIDCTTCANCCRTLQIVVRQPDIKRLATRLGMNEQAFSRIYVRTAADGIMHLKSTPCTFLGIDNRCTVYEDRPQACRDYPYLLDKSFRRRVLTTLENSATCPIVFNVWQLLIRRLWPQKH